MVRGKGGITLRGRGGRTLRNSGEAGSEKEVTLDQTLVIQLGVLNRKFDSLVEALEEFSYNLAHDPSQCGISQEMFVQLHNRLQGLKPKVKKEYSDG